MPIFLPPEGQRRIVDKVDKLLNLYDEAFRKKAAELITIKDIPALSGLPLSHSGQLADILKSNYCKNRRQRTEEPERSTAENVPAENILITCAKDGWHKAQCRWLFRFGL